MLKFFGCKSQNYSISMKQASKQNPPISQVYWKDRRVFSRSKRGTEWQLFWQLWVVEPRAPLAMIQPLHLAFQHSYFRELGQMSAGLVCHGWRAALLEAMPSAHPAPRSVSWVRQCGQCLGVKSTAMSKLVFLCPIPALLLTSWVTRQMSCLASEPHVCHL